ncbi:hydroxyethylthiazole kinase [Limibacillus halophilus]
MTQDRTPEERTDPKDPAEVWRSLSLLRSQRPLVHCVTNYVAMDISANLLLAAGASPVMAHALEEVEDIAGAAGALAINIGTLDERWVESMLAAAKAAVEAGVPWVLDPVGVNATAYRLEVAKRLMGLQPTVIRGNASEIATLGGGGGGGQGVDSTIESFDALDAAQELARKTGAVVAITGAVDYVTNGRELVAVANGHELMSRVTAVGCALTALTAACLAVRADALSAAVHSLVLMGIAGELAAERAQGPASFRMQLLDSLYLLEEPQVRETARIG